MDYHGTLGYFPTFTFIHTRSITVQEHSQFLFIEIVVESMEFRVIFLSLGSHFINHFLSNHTLEVMLVTRYSVEHRVVAYERPSLPLSKRENEHHALGDGGSLLFYDNGVIRRRALGQGRGLEARGLGLRDGAHLDLDVECEVFGFVVVVVGL